MIAAMRQIALALFMFFGLAASAGAQTLHLDGSAIKGRAFSGSGVGGTVPGERGIVHLWNPAGSKVYLYVDRLTVAWNQHCNVETEPPCIHASLGEKLGADLRITTSGVGEKIAGAHNKRVDLPPGHGEVRTGSVPWSEIPGRSPPFMEMWTAEPSRVFEFAAPVILPPGYGLLAVTADPSTQQWPTVWWIVDFQWREMPIE
ncbi:hypothetical protein [Afifella sp. IM 167]|uniref:hypothetical protein n=1 Tax=Afifella sp. IM 167 TaxID=2033586 RepID=UPI001CC9E969|nr:hypothetical protein [Afifella sp. IM 167]MBZ8133211.1 hypothetical protein [Afifella sp. IM 167]